MVFFRSWSPLVVPVLEVVMMILLMIEVVVNDAAVVVGDVDGGAAGG